MKTSAPQTLFGFPVQIVDGLPDGIVVVGKVTVILHGGQPADAVIDGSVIINIGEADAQG